MICSLQKLYKENVVHLLREKFGYKSIMQVPRIEKVVINSGVGDATRDSKFLDSVISEIGLITGQIPVVTRSKVSVSNFKLRENQPIGVKVTLRNKKMWAFLEKLIHVALPRVRDFRGLLSNSFDGKGNFSIGIREQIIFPEIAYDNIKRVRGFDVTIVTSSNNDEQAESLLKLLGFPFIKQNKTPVKEKVSE